MQTEDTRWATPEENNFAMAAGTMKGLIPQHFIDELLSRVDIVEVVDRRVPLKKTGQNYTARCPFHEEKTPSFSVNPDKQFYYCFGCGAGGNAIGFLMEYERLDFPLAIESLATVAGLDPDQTATAMASDEIKGELRENTEKLARRGGFGTPTFFVDDDDMYFGNDRMPLLRAALTA